MTTSITVAADPAYGRIGVTVTGLSSDTPVTVYRTPVDGSSAGVAVRGANPLTVIGGTGFEWDYEAPHGVPVRYSVTDGSTVATSTSITLTLTSPRAIVVGQPIYNMAVLPEAPPALTRKSRSTTVDVLGRSTPVAIVDYRSGVAGSLTLHTLTHSEGDDLDAMLQAGQILFLQLPGSRFGSRYVLVGDVESTPHSDVLDDEGEAWALDFTEVESPQSATRGDPGANYSTVLSAASTYTALLGVSDSYFKLRTGVGLTGGGTTTPPQFVGSVTGYATATTMTTTMPSGIASGDVAVVAVISSNNSASFTLPAGWSLVGSAINPSSSAKFALYSKTLTGSETTLTVTSPIGQILAVGGVYRGAVLDAASFASAVAAASGATVTAPASTVSASNARVLHFFCDRATSALSYFNAPASDTGRAVYLGSTNPNVSGLLSDFLPSSTGATAAAVATMSVSNAISGGFTVVLNRA